MGKTKQRKQGLNSARKHADNLLDDAFGAVAPVAVKKPRKAVITATRKMTRKPVFVMLVPRKT